MSINPQHPEDAVRTLLDSDRFPDWKNSAGSEAYGGVADAMVKALLESGRDLGLKLDVVANRYTNLEDVMSTCHDILDKFHPSAYQAGWAVKAAHELKPAWDAEKSRRAIR